ncbi:hypothetical protein CSE16_08585 [Solibacillus sp. R5-41]|uniref:hypothetical protein n=1 Tax=Solibacillus sp. R5-41 TaxID=2048654 RepID=UPI000C126009|nr:hypothetical protein [Solibacillus sp. R5-41]ATP40103.1 hypothetical protein CSE16_08585 [Solibacillus sp. R5-41]
MKEWWQKKKSKTRRRRKGDDNYSLFDFLLEVLFWIPELILFPLRLIFWMLRGLGKLIGEVFNVV